MSGPLLKELAKAKVEFQLRGLLTALGIDPNGHFMDDKQCQTCGDSDCIGGLACETGDGEA
jgi:hypothetical protein